MYVVDDKIKVNTFKVVAIPRNCEYMARFGRQTAVSSMFTGEDKQPPVNGNKVDMLYQAEVVVNNEMKDDSSES